MQQSAEWVATRKEYLMISLLHLMVRRMMCVWWAERPGSVDATGIGDSINCGADYGYAQPQDLANSYYVWTNNFNRVTEPSLEHGRVRNINTGEKMIVFRRNHIKMYLMLVRWSISALSVYGGDGMISSVHGHRHSLVTPVSSLLSLEVTSITLILELAAYKEYA